MKYSDFIREVRAMRREDKNAWHYLVRVVEGKQVKMKWHGTWNQVLEVDGVRYGGCMGLNVGGWLTEIHKAIIVGELWLKYQIEDAELDLIGGR
jgi:hypothetical protein